MTWAMHKLRMYKQIPATGLAIFSGHVTSQDVVGKTRARKLCVDLVPFKPLKYSMYYCDNRFHGEQLQEQLTELLSMAHVGSTGPSNVGFVVVCGEGALLGALNGSDKEVLAKMHVNLPRKHNKGGQSSKRFERLQKQARAAYVKGVAELINKTFISAQQQQTIVGSLVFAGVADLKTLVSQCPLLDHRIRKLPLTIVDVGYGFDLGFQEAIDLTSETLQDMRFVKESQLIQHLMDEIAKETNRTVYGVRETMLALDQGIVERLIVYENLDILRVTVVDTSKRHCVDPMMDSSDEIGGANGAAETESSSSACLYMSPAQFQLLLEKTNNTRHGDSLMYECELLIEWLAEHYERKKIELDIVGKATPEGKQFARGFGGLGGFLRFEVSADLVALSEDPTTPMASHFGLLRQITTEESGSDLSEYA